MRKLIDEYLNVQDDSLITLVNCITTFNRAGQSPQINTEVKRIKLVPWRLMATTI